MLYFSRSAPGHGDDSYATGGLENEGGVVTAFSYGRSSIALLGIGRTYGTSKSGDAGALPSSIA